MWETLRDSSAGDLLSKRDRRSWPTRSWRWPVSAGAFERTATALPEPGTRNTGAKFLGRLPVQWSLRESWRNSHRCILEVNICQWKFRTPREMQRLGAKVSAPKVACGREIVKQLLLTHLPLFISWISRNGKLHKQLTGNSTFPSNLFLVFATSHYLSQRPYSLFLVHQSTNYSRSV